MIQIVKFMITMISFSSPRWTQSLLLRGTIRHAHLLMIRLYSHPHLFSKKKTNKMREQNKTTVKRRRRRKREKSDASLRDVMTKVVLPVDKDAYEKCKKLSNRRTENWKRKKKIDVNQIPVVCFHWSLGSRWRTVELVVNDWDGVVGRVRSSDFRACWSLWGFS